MGDQMDTNNIKHMGKVQGGCNWNARLSLRFYAADITSEEGTALTEEFRTGLEWKNKWVQSHPGEAHSSYEYAFDSRREFSLLPLMIRRFVAFGYEARLANWGHEKTVSLTSDPETFWREIALAQMFYRED